MRNKKDLFIWENLQAEHKLKGFFENLNKYCNYYSEDKILESEKLRVNMMKDAKEIEDLFWIAGTPPIMSLGSRAAGMQQLSIVQSFPKIIESSYESFGSISIFNTARDMYLRVIGIYEKNRLRSLLNIINIFLFIRVVISIFLNPVFEIFNVDENAQRKGVWGGIVKLINLIGYLIVIWELITLLGLNQKVLEYFK